MTDNQLISPEDVIHYAETDTSGEPGDCIDDCFGCVLDRVVGYLEARGDVSALGDEIQALDGHTLFVDDVAALVRAATEHDPTSDAAQQREERAVAEARPHDDEPVLGDVIKCQQCGRQSRSISRGCSACGWGKPSEPLPFLGFTRDGHAVGGPVPDDVPTPALVARCGGPATCSACANDADDLRRAAGEADRG